MVYVVLGPPTLPQLLRLKIPHLWNIAPERHSRETSTDTPYGVSRKHRQYCREDSPGVAGGERVGASDVGDTHQDTQRL